MHRASQKLHFGNLSHSEQWLFCFVIMLLMYRKHGQSVEKGIPALVCVATDQTITIKGKTYKVLKLMYDLKGEYLPLATMRPNSL